MQLEIYSPAEQEHPQPIRWNYEELKAGLTEALAAYKGRVYTAENIGAAKKDRAALNKLAGALSDKRKELKARCLEPYQLFEQQTGELIALIKEQSDAIDVQVKAYESDRADKKREEIESFYREKFPDLVGLIPYRQIHNPRWLNVTYEMKKIQMEIEERMGQVRQDLGTVEALETPFRAQIEAKFLETLSLGQAMAEKARLEESERKMADYRAEQKEMLPAPEPEPSAPVQLPDESTKHEEPLYTVDFRVTGTKGQLKALQRFLKENQIAYGKVV